MPDQWAPDIMIEVCRFLQANGWHIEMGQRNIAQLPHLLIEYSHDKRLACAITEECIDQLERQQLEQEAVRYRARAAQVILKPVLRLEEFD